MEHDVTIRPNIDDTARRWLLAELRDCLDSWRGTLETAGHGSYAAIAWEGRTDQALRMAVHFGLISPDAGRAMIAAVDERASSIRALAEPDGEGIDYSASD
jgi:hypothetical protein